jgi:hypothetical protein
VLCNGAYFQTKICARYWQYQNHIRPIAYFCLGYVNELSDKTDLENAGWLPRLEVGKVICYDQWGSNDPSGISTAI